MLVFEVWFIANRHLHIHYRGGDGEEEKFNDVVHCCIWNNHWNLTDYGDDGEQSGYGD
jgi:hypothetical protein